LRPGAVLVKTVCSAISGGTELSSIAVKRRKTYATDETITALTGQLKFAQVWLPAWGRWWNAGRA